jgi:hypothetical protein
MGGLRKQRAGLDAGRPISAPKRETPITARPEGAQTTEKESEMTQNIRAPDVNDLSFINPKGLYDRLRTAIRIWLSFRQIGE